MLAVKEVFLKTKSKGKKKSAFGCLSEYADASKIPLEKGAWEREVAKKMPPQAIVGL